MMPISEKQGTTVTLDELHEALRTTVETLEALQAEFVAFRDQTITWRGTNDTRLVGVAADVAEIKARVVI